MLRQKPEIYQLQILSNKSPIAYQPCRFLKREGNGFECHSTLILCCEIVLWKSHKLDKFRADPLVRVRILTTPARLDHA